MGVRSLPACGAAAAERSAHEEDRGAPAVDPDAAAVHTPRVVLTARRIAQAPLEADPHETRNIAAPGFKKSRKQRKALKKLKKKLASVEATRLQPL